MVKSNRIFTPRQYLEYIDIEFDNHEPMNDLPLDFLHRVLKENNKSFWDYPLDFYDKIQYETPNIVLVNCSYYDGKEMQQEYRWFEV